MYFRKYRLRKTWLDKCLKSRGWENTSTENLANGVKHCCNLNDTTFTIFSTRSEGSCIRKSLF